MSEPVGKGEGWIGRTLEGRYEVTGVIGEGGMGAVFKARHLLLDMEVALKVVLPGLAGNEELVARFAREAAVTSRLDHPNVISVSDSGRLEDGSAYIAMPYVRGPSLTHVLESEGALHWSRVVSLGAQLADALAAARGKGIVHRDLKPDNILLQRLDDGRDLVKVLDFGIARFARESLAPPGMRGLRNNLTQTGLVVGTPGYMAPEQSVGEQADHRADLYSLGVILWECLTGERLWPGDEVAKIVEAQFTTEPRHPKGVVGDPDVPDALDAIVMQLLARRVGDRPQDPSTVKEVLLALAPDQGPLMVRTGTQPRTQPLALGHVSVAELPTALDVDVPLPAQPAPPLPPQQAPLGASGARPSRLPRRGRTLALLGLLCLTLFGAAAALVGSGIIEVTSTQNLGQVAQQFGVNLPPALKNVHLLKARADLGVPPSLEPAMRTLMNGDTRSGRVEAARALLGHIPIDAVDPYIRSVAQMQLAETCMAKSEALETIIRVDDPRALPALHRLASRPRTGCGKRNNRDCLACMRAELNHAISDLEQKQIAP